MSQALTGAVAAVSRTDSALRLNVHFHILALDGVYVREEDDGPLVFYPLPTPTRSQVAEVARRTAERIEKLLRKTGRSLDPEMMADAQPELALEEPGLAACYAAAAAGLSISGDRAGQPPLRLITSRQPEAGPGQDDDVPAAEVRGVNVYAKQCVDGRDRRQLERLCKYITRPPIAQGRLERRADGKLELSFKGIWKDGSTGVVFEPHDLIVRLIASVPPPYFHTLRYFSVLSSHSAARSEVVPKPPPDPTQRRPPPAPGDQLELLDSDDEKTPKRRRWAWLIRHVFLADVDKCARCGGPMRWMDAAGTPQAAERLLAKLGLAPQPPPCRGLRLSGSSACRSSEGTALTSHARRRQCRRGALVRVKIVRTAVRGRLAVQGSGVRGCFRDAPRKNGRLADPGLLALGPDLQHRFPFHDGSQGLSTHGPRDASSGSAGASSPVVDP